MARALGDNHAAVDIADEGDMERLRHVSSVTRPRYTVKDDEQPIAKNPLVRLFHWYKSWAIPGLGMFSEAYIIFSLGLIKPLQSALYPSCFKTYEACTANKVKVQNYIQICGIIIGMLFFGFLGDRIGRRWGSRLVATIMMTGSILLVFTPLVPNPGGYLDMFIVAQTWYGFGVGGEYPMASSSATERSEASAYWRKRRGEQVVLTFSNQGMGNFVNGCVILTVMAIYNLTGPTLDPIGSRNTIMIQFAVGAAVATFMVLYRFFRLKESKVWQKEREDFDKLAEEVDVVDRKVHKTEKKHKRNIVLNATVWFWPRLLVTCFAWVANDFAFYGNKLFQNTFIALLYPNATQFVRMQWTVLNSAIALVGYWCAAALIDKPWYGRRTMQTVGFVMMFVLFIICGIAFPTLTASATGLHAFQFLYFFSSFFNQFGPNCTTWLVAAEVFPTDVRATFQGTSAAWGKVGAIIADVVFGYVSQRTTFYLSAAFGIAGAIATVIFLPDTTELSIAELDRMAKFMLADEFHHYHGEAINPKFLSMYERWVLRWQRHYNPALDAQQREVEMSGLTPEQQAKRLEHILQEEGRDTGTVVDARG